MQQYMIRGHARNGYLAFWNVTTDDGVYGDYLSENAALLDAVDAAQETGHPAQVLIHGLDGTDAVRWGSASAQGYRKGTACTTPGHKA
jgi:hypothetical protein